MKAVYLQLIMLYSLSKPFIMKMAITERVIGGKVPVSLVTGKNPGHIGKHTKKSITQSVIQEGNGLFLLLCKHDPEEPCQGANNNGSLVVMAVNSLPRLMGNGSQSWTTRRFDDCHDQGSVAPWKHVRVFVGVWMDFCVSHQASCTSFWAQV